MATDDRDLVTIGAKRGGESRSEKSGAARDDDLHAADASLARASPSATFTRVRTRAPQTKKKITDNTAARLEPKMLTDAAKSAGPAMPANFSNTEKNPKYSDDLCFGIMRANSDRLRAWLPPCTVPTRNASAKNCHAVVMK